MVTGNEKVTIHYQVQKQHDGVCWKPPPFSQSLDLDFNFLTDTELLSIFSCRIITMQLQSVFQFLVVNDTGKDPSLW
jgi:hypothetical protein